MFPFIKNAMFAGVDLTAIEDGSGQRHINVFQDVFDLMSSGILRPAYPVQTYNQAQAAHAFRTLVSGKSSGKTVLRLEDNAIVPCRESEDSDYRFSPNATYVVAGGLGGIGRQITRWMVRRGAKNIVVLARSGPERHTERVRMIAELQAQGVNLLCKVCDISKVEEVRKAIMDDSHAMPPIKGCFQSAMVIRDRTFAAMTSDEWCLSVFPKVQGSWNLHSVLPRGMDFFVMLSSATCIFGNAGQANYAAANTFQDALARHRVALGEKAIAIDLGMVLDEGWLAERQDIHHRVMQFDHVLSLSQRELFSLLDYYCSPSTTFSSPATAQLVTGIELPAMIRRGGRQVPEVLNRPLFRAMHQVLPARGGTSLDTKKPDDYAAILQGIKSLAAAGAVIAEALKAKLCKILGLDAESTNIHDRMDSFGVDSLIALEIRNWLAREMRAEMAVYEILGDVTLVDIGLTAARKSGLRQNTW
ncbi:KR domain-containing protein [Xylariomycetidae sp. FL0641]|nr:KR domain-containing protein [Xylariomycetidae sp. FL0641]